MDVSRLLQRYWGKFQRCFKQIYYRKLPSHSSFWTKLCDFLPLVPVVLRVHMFYVLIFFKVKHSVFSITSSPCVETYWMWLNCIWGGASEAPHGSHRIRYPMGGREHVVESLHCNFDNVENLDCTYHILENITRCFPHLT